MVLPSVSDSSSFRGRFRAAIELITSLGASKCHVARVLFELAPTVTAKMCSFGRLVLSRARNISAA